MQRTLFSLFLFLLSFSALKAHWEPVTCTQLLASDGNVATAADFSNPLKVFSVEDHLYDSYTSYYGTFGVNIPFVRENHIVDRFTLALKDTAYLPDSYFELEVALQIRLYKKDGSFITENIPLSDSFKIKYNPLSGVTDFPSMTKTFKGYLKFDYIITDITYRHISGGVLVTNTTPVNSDLPLSFSLNTCIEVDRVYNYEDPLFRAPSDIPFVYIPPTAREIYADVYFSADEIGCANEVMFNWPTFTLNGLMHYEIEWTFIDASTVDLSDPVNFSFEASFLNNSTRVQVTGLSYSIPMIYNKGFIVARIRGISEDFFKRSLIYRTPWSLPDQVTIYHNSSNFQFEASPGLGLEDIQFVYEVSDHGQEHNWQHSSAFAEEGKRIQTISYYDGMMRQRQSMTMLSTERVPVAGEIIYDYLGRPAITPLATPVKNLSGLDFRPGLTISAGTDEPYTWEDFDPDYEDCENTQTARMKTNSGASNYYSSESDFFSSTCISNTQKEMLSFVPDAGGYPFAQVEYMPDGTGRVRRQGGLGKTHQLTGVDDQEDPVAGREVTYYYAYPTQTELDRLFGNEVGYVSGYSKTYVRDQNGQLAVSYIDPAGRVIATALVGDPENTGNLDALPGAVGSVHEDIVSPITNNRVNETDGIMSVAYEYFVSKEGSGVYQFYYTMASPKFEDLCDEGLCFDCIYDLSMSIKDECGQELIPGGAITETVGSINYTCGSDSIKFTTSPSPLSLSLTEGTIRIEKTLKINQTAYKAYLKKYEETLEACLPDYSTIYDEEKAKLTDICDEEPDCENCETNLATLLTNNDITQLEYDYEISQCKATCNPTPCTNLLRAMLEDFSPGGQYFDNTSTFQPGVNNPEDFVVDSSWLEANVADKAGFFSTINSTFGLDYTGWSQIRDIYREEFAFLLIENHPEYCLYENCLAIEGTYLFDKLMLGSESPLEARTNGYFNPIGSNTNTVDYPAPGSGLKDPFFVSSGGSPIHYYYEMREGLALFPGSSSGAWQYLYDVRADSKLAGLTGEIDCPSEYDFSLFFAIYQTVKAPLITRYYDSLYSCVPTTILKEERFIIEPSSLSTLSDEYDPNPAIFRNNIENLIKEDCDDRCDALSESWLAMLTPCEISDPDHREALKTELQFICRHSCDEMNPLGLAHSNIPTVNNNRSFQEAFAWVMSLGSYTPSAECNNLIAGSALQQSADLVQWGKNLDECGCDKIAALSDEYQTKKTNNELEAGICSEEDYFFAELGERINIPLAKCACNQLNSGSPLAECEEYNTALADKACERNRLQKAHELQIILKRLLADNLLLGGGVIDLAVLYPEYMTSEWALYNGGECSSLTYDATLTNFGKTLEVNLDGCDVSCYFTFTLPDDANFPDFTVVESISMTSDDPDNLVFEVKNGEYTAELTFDPGCLLNCTDQTIVYPPIPMPQSMECHPCVECEALTTWYTSFVSEYNDIYLPVPGEYATASLFQLFIRNKHGINLPVADLQAALRSCLNQNECPVNSFGISYVGLLKKIIDNGDISETTIALDNNDYGEHFAIFFPDGHFKGKNPRVLKISSKVYTITNDLNDSCSFYLNEPLNSGMALVTDMVTASNLAIYTIIISQTNPGLSDHITLTSACNILTECPELVLTICPQEPEEDDVCERLEEELATANAMKRYQDMKDEALRNFRLAYYKKCMQAFEKFQMKYDLWEYHYTLFYYDQAGNLVKTVPPAGVTPITNAGDLEDVQEYRASGGTRVMPSHNLITNYKYNTLNQRIEKLTPDGGTTRFWYDWLGRNTLSQDATQNESNLYSYKVFDALGRTTEFGEITLPTAPSAAEAADATMLETILGNEESSKTQITRTYYDEPFTAGGPIKGLVQENLRLRIASISFQQTFDDPEEYNFASHYTYDIHGNITKEVEDYPFLDAYQHRFKTAEYLYDLIAGNLHISMYQAGEIDEWYHYYQYDAGNRLKTVYTSRHFDPEYLRGKDLPNLEENPYWNRDGYYDYYLHGPLARLSLSSPVVQGIDYSYTIQGWLKNMNSAFLHPEHDMGQDGNSSHIFHGLIPRDVFSMELQYYAGDYSRIGTSAADPNPSKNASSFLALNSYDLFNGGISQLTTSIPDPAALTTGTYNNSSIGQTFRYDQLNRLTLSLAHSDYDVDLSPYEWPSSTGSVNEQYKTAYTYDANGNIQSLFRNGEDNNLPMDELSYHYNAATNQLNYVTELQADANNYPDDVEDQEADNYLYDASGNLVADAEEEIETIEWTVSGKVKRITRATGSMKPDLEFEYNSYGRRVKKTEYLKPLSSNNINRTIYVNDVSGNLLQVYQLNTRRVSDIYYDTLYSIEKIIYGASRLGLLKSDRVLGIREYTIVANEVATEAYTLKTRNDYALQNNRHTRGEKRLEISNYQGNVQAIVADRRIGKAPSGDPNAVESYQADVRMLYDYYPFGMIIPDRIFINNGCKYESQPPVEIIMHEEDFEDIIADPSAIGTWETSDPDYIHATYDDACQCFQVNTRSTGPGNHYIFTEITPTAGVKNVVTVTLESSNISNCYVQVVDPANNLVLANIKVDNIGAIPNTIELEYWPQTGVSPTVQLRIYSEPYTGGNFTVHSVRWYYLSTNTMYSSTFEDYNMTTGFWSPSGSASISNGVGNDVLEITSSGIGYASNTYSVVSEQLYKVGFDLNIGSAPGVWVEILDATSMKILAREHYENISGLTDHKVNLSVYAENSNIEVRIHTPGPTIGAITVDNLSIEKSGNVKSGLYTQTFAISSGNWGGGPSIYDPGCSCFISPGGTTSTYNSGCNCLEVQSYTDGQYSKEQTAQTVVPGIEYFLSMDVNISSTAMLQIEVVDGTTEAVIASRVLNTADGINYRVAMAFMPTSSSVILRARRVLGVGTTDFYIDNVSMVTYWETAGSTGGLDMQTTLDLSDWSVSGSAIKKANVIDGTFKLEIQSNDVYSMASRSMNTKAGQVHELTLTLERLGYYTGTAVVAVIDPGTFATLGSQSISSGSLTNVSFTFTPSTSTVLLRIYNAGDYTVVDDIKLTYDRVVIHTICDNSMDYRFGYNGQERDNSIMGFGNSMSAEYWQYDARLGRRWNMDPMAESYAWQSPYAAFNNNPVYFVDPLGLEGSGTNENPGPLKRTVSNLREKVQSRWDIVFDKESYDMFGKLLPLTTVESQASIREGPVGFWNTLRVTNEWNPVSRPGMKLFRLLSELVYQGGYQTLLLGEPDVVDLEGNLVGQKAKEQAGIGFLMLFAPGPKAIKADAIVEEATVVASTAMNAVDDVVAKGVMNPSEIHFMQSSIKNTTGNYTVLENAEALANGSLNPDVLTMNVWKDASGKVWTLDHRRLGAFRLSGLQEAPIQWANPSGQMWKMTTTTGGTSIKLKLGGVNYMIIK